MVKLSRGRTSPEPPGVYYASGREDARQFLNCGSRWSWSSHPSITENKRAISELAEAPSGERERRARPCACCTRASLGLHP